MPAITIENKITIQKPLFEVFKYAGNPETYPEWQPKTNQVRITAGNPLRSGSMISINRGSTFINADLVDYQRNKEILLRGMWGRFQFERKTRFESMGGATGIDDRLTVQVGWLFFWYVPILQMTLNGEISKEWETLKQRLNG